MKCQRCGTENDNSAVYCSHCGSRLTGVVSESNPFTNVNNGNNNASGVPNNPSTPTKPFSMAKLIVFVILSVIAFTLASIALYTSIRIAFTKISSDSEPFYYMWFALGSIAGLVISVICFGTANKMGREKQPHPGLQVLIVILSAFGLAFSVVALAFQGIHFVIY